MKSEIGNVFSNKVTKYPKSFELEIWRWYSADELFVAWFPRIFDQFRNLREELFADDVCVSAIR